MTTPENELLFEAMQGFRELEKAGEISNVHFEHREIPASYLDIGGGQYLVTRPHTIIDAYFVPKAPVKRIDLFCVITREGLTSESIS